MATRKRKRSKLALARIPKEYDRRRKLTDEQRIEIMELKGIRSSRSVGDEYGVDHSLILRMWNPEQLKRNIECRAKNGGSKQYYDRERHSKYMRDYQAYKKKLVEEGKLKLE